MTLVSGNVPEASAVGSPLVQVVRMRYLMVNEVSS